MINRLKGRIGPPPREPEGEGDYWVVASVHGQFTVGRETAAAVELALDSVPAPCWLAFRDLAGARHRVLAAAVTAVWESTAAQRAAEREFYRARRLEEKADQRPWEDDD